MPLDPSIFIQGAQLRAQNQERTQSSINKFMDTMNKRKQDEVDKQKALETDYEGSAQRVILAQAKGQQPSPDDVARAQVWDKMNTVQNGIDPYGNVYQKNRSLFDTIGTTPSNATYKPQFPSVPNYGINPAGGAMPPQAPNQGYTDDIGVLPVGDNYAEVSGVTMPQRDAARGVVATTGNPRNYAEKKEFDANIALQEQAIKDKMAIENKKNEPMGVDQGNAALFADRMREADAIIGDKLITAEQLNLKNRVSGDIPVAGNYLVTPNYQKAAQAERNFINALLRKESGAVIAESEFDNARKQYFPQPNDTEDVIKQKAQNRKTAIEGISRAAGAAYKPKEQAVDTNGIVNWSDLK